MPRDSGDYADLVVEVAGGVMRVTINRPERRNALRAVTIDELTDAFVAGERDPSVGVIVLTGAGDKAFCAGGDFSDRTEDIGEAAVDFGRQLLRLSVVMRGCGKPVIARVHGWAVAAGNELQLLCDLAVATSDSRFRQGGPDVGSVPAWWGCQLLPLVMGDRRAREAVLLGRTYSAQEAESLGLINAAVPAEDLDETVDEWCKRLLAMSAPALQASKSLLNANSGMFTGAMMQGYDQLLTHHTGSDAVARLGGVVADGAPEAWSGPRP